jgi:hypothetical protein
MMVADNTVAAAVSNTRRRDLSLVLQATGFPLGARAGRPVRDTAAAG